MRSPELTALTRFGLGPRPGDRERVRGDAVGYVRAQLDDPGAVLLSGPGLPSSDAIRERYRAVQLPIQLANRADREGRQIDEAEREAALETRREAMRTIEASEVGARYRQGVTTGHPFLERLVLFFSNHFAIDRKQGIAMKVLAGSFEREAIRPHVLGSFADMLVAATTHPAMLIYLDNHRSMGPNSRAGRRRGGVAANENLAREILELHTLGAGGGYTQDDVIELAHVLSGWTGGFALRRHNPTFDRNWHEPGVRRLLDTTYPAGGEEQLGRVLPDLAQHPSTARHIATKLARHFVRDETPPALVERLTDTFLVSGGDLKAVATALVDSEEAWVAPPAKVVPPYDFMVATGRALGFEPGKIPPAHILRSSAVLAHEIWAPPSPAGWPDDDIAFLGGDSLLERVDFARMAADRFGRGRDPRALARELLGADLDPFLAEAIDRAEDRRQGLVLLLMSAPFQRR